MGFGSYRTKVYITSKYIRQI